MSNTPAFHIPTAVSSSQPSFYRTKRRDFLLPFLAGVLVLIGSFQLAKYGDLSEAENVSKFQVSFGFIALGYILSWQFSRRMIWLMLVVAALARIAVLPISSGESMNRMIWDSKVLAADMNPYEVSPDDPALEIFRGPEWEKFSDKGQISQAMPGRLWAYHAAWEMGEPSKWLKVVFILLDLALCLIFATRFGADRAVLYAWNPLVIYSVGGLGVDSTFFLVPMVVGYLIWEFWIDQKGGVSAIKASGGIGSALGQMVCLSTLFIGIGVALNILFLPMLLWIVWHVLKRSGFAAGLVTIVFGFAPLVLSLMWASISLNLEIWQVLPVEFSKANRAISLFPGILSFFFPAVIEYGYWFLAILTIASIWMIHRCDSIERFASFYLVWALALATSIYPWSFLALAIVGVGGGNYTFRVASLSAFAYFGAYRIFGDTGLWAIPWTLQVLVWLPVLFVAAQFAVLSRSKDGFYVHTF